MRHIRPVVVGIAIFSATPSLAHQGTQADVDTYLRGLKQTTREAYDDCLRGYEARVDQDQCVVDYRRTWDESWRVEHRIDFSPCQEAQIKKHAMLIDFFYENARVLLTQKIEAERRSGGGDGVP